MSDRELTRLFIRIGFVALAFLIAFISKLVFAAPFSLIGIGLGAFIAAFPLGTLQFVQRNMIFGGIIFFGVLALIAAFVFGIVFMPLGAAALYTLAVFVIYSAATAVYYR